MSTRPSYERNGNGAGLLVRPLSLLLVLGLWGLVEVGQINELLGAFFGSDHSDLSAK